MYTYMWLTIQGGGYDHRPGQGVGSFAVTCASIVNVSHRCTHHLLDLSPQHQGLREGCFSITRCGEVVATNN